MIPYLSVCVLDKQQLFVEGLSRIIGDLAIVAKVHSCHTNTQLHQVLAKEPVDVLFLDIKTTEGPRSGLDICARIKQQNPDVHIAILTDYDSKLLRNRARKSGASAYITKSTSPAIIETFLSRFKPGATKKFFIGAKPLPQISTAVLTNDVQQLKELLTVREREIFALLSNCSTNAEIQTQLSISYDTLRTHRDNIVRKLQLKNAAQIVQFAHQNGLVE